MEQVYKKTGTCSRPSGAQTDYPMYLVVGESAGSPAIFPSLGMVLNYPTAHNSTYVKSTSDSAGFYPYLATDPGLSLTGTHTDSSWMSARYSVTNQRLHIDLGSAKVVRGVYYENFHDSGTRLTRGAKNFIMQGSAESSAFAELTYATDTDWTQIGGSMQFEQHSAVNAANPKYIGIANSAAYRYIALKIADNWGDADHLGLRRIVLLTDEGFVHCSGHCQDDFGDIRFHDAADAELKYMIDWGSLTGTTPNQSVGVWVAPSPGTPATNVVLKYGDSALTDASCAGTDIFIKYKNFEAGSDGVSVATADEDWTIVSGTFEIDTAQKYGGTRSAKMVGGSAMNATLPHTAASGTYAIRLRAYKEDACGNTFLMAHGNGTKRLTLQLGSGEQIQYLNAEGKATDTGTVCTADAWHLYELANIDFSAGTYDIYYDGALIKADVGMNTNSGVVDVLWVYCNESAGNDAWIDDLIVRKYANPEPTWGTWGAEEEIGSTPTPSGIKALGPTASASIKAYGPTAWGSVKAL